MALLEVAQDSPAPAFETCAFQFPVQRIRQLDHSNLAVLADFLLRLDRDSRCRRFGWAAADAALAAHPVRALEAATCVVGVTVDDVLRGVLELYAGAPGSATEAAIVVEQGWRRRGLGWALVQAARARLGGQSGLRFIFTRDNWPMRQLASKASARFDLLLDEICADVAPARTSLSSFFKREHDHD